MILKGLVKGRDKLESASLSRIYQHRMTQASGSISACRSMADDFYLIPEAERNRMIETNDPALKKYKLTQADNKKRTQMLRDDLKKLGADIGFIMIKGMYREEGMAQAAEETSFFVYALNPKFKLKDTLLRLGYKYNQDAITYSSRGGQNYELICTTAIKEGLDGGSKRYTFGKRMAFLPGDAWGEDGIFNLTNYSMFRGKPFAWGAESYKAKQMAESTIQAFQTRHRESYHIVKSSIPGRTKMYTYDDYYLYDKLLTSWGVKP